MSKPKLAVIVDGNLAAAGPGDKDNIDGLGTAATGDITQEAGDSQTDVMSQKAITDALNTKANTSTQVIAGTGLDGGGDLTANRTLSVNYGTTEGTAAQGNDSRIVNSVQTSGDQSITGVKTFSSFPVTPSAAPTDAYQVANKKYVDAVAASVGERNVTGSITLNGTTDNAVVLSDIVPELGLEVGDVIRIDTGTYNKLHTVESITDNSSIIVNYEHAGNRGDGSLKLPNFTGQATVTRIAKWFNAPIGLGQAWVNLTSSRVFNISYPNTTGRTIHANILVAGTGQNLENVKLLVGGVTVLESENITSNELLSISAPIPVTPSYSLTYEKLTTLLSWSELR